MAATLLLTNTQVEADRRGWLAARQPLVTASEIGVITGLVPGHWGGPHSLYWSKKGSPEPRRETDEQALGTYLEEWVARQFAKKHPGLVVGDGGLFVSDKVPWMGATFDRLAFPSWVQFPGPELADIAVAPVQCKTVGSLEDWGSDPAEGKIPAYIRAQALWEMEILGTDRVYVPMMYRPSGWTRTYLLERSDPDVREDIAWMMDEAASFRARLANDDPPPVDWRPSTTATLKRLHPDLADRDAVVTRRLADRYKAVQLARARLNIREGQVTNELREAMGDAARAVTSDPATGETVKLCTRLKYDVGPFENPGGPRDMLRVAAWAKAPKPGRAV